ncbi:MAG: hypothetical protein OJF49_002326 [Ktedonobacterales bacterium]|jgi:hypothetical protein|nr:MAG: hypothetical protein OJF49_002326 [Ktedonobacterales bacterium]
MRPTSWLDQFVYRFQHRWETDPRYRSVVTGVVGLALVLTICACMGVMTTTANSALAAIGLGTGTNGAVSTRTGSHQNDPTKKFPVNTPYTSTYGLPPVTTIPNSKTPLPSPTAAPTDTPDPGGGSQPACNGSHRGVTWTITPCQPVAGQNVTLTISAPRFAGNMLYLDIRFGACSGDDPNCRWYFFPTTLDANGNWSATKQLPVGDGPGPTYGNYSIQGGPGGVIVGYPVQ